MAWQQRQFVWLRCLKVDPNICCTCFVQYDETGTDWISCTYGRWLHEDCVEDITLDDEGKERMCLFYLDVLTL